MRHSPNEKYLSSWIQQYLKPDATGHFQLSEPIKIFSHKPVELRGSRSLLYLFQALVPLFPPPEMSSLLLTFANSEATLIKTIFII